MKEDLKQRIHALVDHIEDEAKLLLLMQDMQSYLSENDEDELTDEEKAEIDEASEAIGRGE